MYRGVCMCVCDFVRVCLFVTAVILCPLFDAFSKKGIQSINQSINLFQHSESTE